MKRKSYFSEHPEKTFWEGHALAFLKELYKDELMAVAVLRTFNPGNVGTALSTLKAKGFPIETREEDGEANLHYPPY